MSPYSQTPELQSITPAYHLQILENRHPEPLGEAEGSELKRILQVAEHEFASRN